MMDADGWSTPEVKEKRREVCALVFLCVLQTICIHAKIMCPHYVCPPWCVRVCESVWVRIHACVCLASAPLQ